MSIAEARALTGLFHEQQIGALCGQHVLNNLLQGPYVTLDALREIARKLDHEEKAVLYNRSNEPVNLEEEGFSNIQVLQAILQNMDLELIPFKGRNKIADEARARPDRVNAYVFNLAEHWFTVRKFGNYYFDLNSMYTVPHLLGCDEFAQFMDFIQNSGGSIFVVHGPLPDCEAEQRLNSPTFDPFKYVNIVKRLPIYCVDRDLFVSLEGPGPDGKYILRLPPKIMDEYERNPDSTEFQKKVNAILPPEAKGRVVFVRQTENQETILTTTTTTRTLLIIRKHQCGQHACLKCQFSDNVSQFNDTIMEYRGLLEQVIRCNHQAMASQSEITSRIERNLRDIEKHSTAMKLVDRMCEVSNKLIEDTRRFEDIVHNLEKQRWQRNRSKLKESDLPMIIDGFKQAFVAKDTLNKDLKMFDEALDQYQLEQAMQESLSTMKQAETPEPMKRKPPSTSVNPPTPPEDRRTLVNTTSFDLIVPDSSLPTDDDPPTSLPVPESPPPSPSPAVPEMTIEELRTLRRQKFGNRNVSLVSGIYSPMDP